MEDILRAIAEAAYNGVCLAAENDDSTPWNVRGVSGINANEYPTFMITLPDGQSAQVQVTPL